MAVIHKFFAARRKGVVDKVASPDRRSHGSQLNS